MQMTVVLLVVSFDAGEFDSGHNYLEAVPSVSLRK